MKKTNTYFSKTDIALWVSSAILVIVSFYIFDRKGYLTLCASLIGVTSLIFNAKGNPFGQLLMIIFSLLYGIISYTFRYYGEMVTYLGMTMPMAFFALISWLKNPYNGNMAEVKVNINRKRKCFYMADYCYSHHSFLFHTKIFQHREYNSKHNFRYNKLSCCISYIQKKSVFCFGLCFQ